MGMSQLMRGSARIVAACLLVALVPTIAGAQELPKRYDVLALNKTYDQPTNSTFRLTEHSLADVLNLALGPLFWADEACDLGKYVELYGGVQQIVLDSIDQKRDPAESQLKALLEVLPSPPLDATAGPERYRKRHCGIYLAQDGSMNPQFRPKHAMTLDVPCLVPVRADKSDLLWCSRQATFYSEALKGATDAAMKSLRALFVACGSIDSYKAKFEPTAQAAYASVVEANADGLHFLRDGLVDEYDLRRIKRAPLADEMIRTDRGLISSLISAYSVPRFSAWCGR